MDAYTLIDTALKIGLGALISGVATYLTSKLNAEKSKEKYILEHRIKTIEVASEKIEEFFDAWMSVITKVGAISRKASEGNGEERNFTDAEKKQVKERDSTLIETWASKQYAISRFRLLGADEVVKAILATNKPHSGFRDKVIFENKVLPYEEFEALRAEVNKLRREVQNATSAYYQTICS